jgi:hypothetical protein
MQARRIIEGAAFGPEIIRAAGVAFDSAWSEVADRFDTSTHAAVREVLATAIIAAAREDSIDPDPLRRAGLNAMARAFPDRFAPGAALDRGSRGEN